MKPKDFNHLADTHDEGRGSHVFKDLADKDLPEKDFRAYAGKVLNVLDAQRDLPGRDGDEANHAATDLRGVLDDER